MASTETLIFTESPLSAKHRFHLRPVYNWVGCGIVFTFVAILLRLIISGAVVWLLDLAAIAIFTYINFYILGRRAIPIRCPHCGRLIATNTPWICGTCGKKNVQTDEFPFINRCGHPECGAESISYRCSYDDCKQLIFFTHDQRTMNFARSCDDTTEQATKTQRSERRQTAQETIEDKRVEVEIAKLDRELRELKRGSEVPKLESELERKKKAFDSGYEAGLGIGGHAQKRRAEAEAEFANDRERLEKAHELINALERRLGTG